jgi:DNA-directed RNA polymerase specialized sigma24 family protein
MFEEYSLELSEDKLETVEAIIIKESVRSLPHDQQAVIALSVAGFRQKEISLILDISRTTVWSKRVSALSSLKEHILGVFHGT